MHLFISTLGSFKGDEQARQNIDQLSQWTLKTYAPQVAARASFHEFVSDLPSDVVDRIDALRNAPSLISDICAQFEVCDVTPLSQIDELYISHYNMDKAGDQGLFDKHYDGTLRGVMPGMTVVRALIYLSSNDDYVVHFLDSEKEANMKTYDYAILDFNRELHYVSGTYSPTAPPRIMLKCNYLVCPGCSPAYKRLITRLTEWTSFGIVRKSMNYSKDPQSPCQYVVGWACNLFRVLVVISPWLALLVAALMALLLGLVLYLVVRWVIFKISSVSGRTSRPRPRLRPRPARRITAKR